MNDATREYGQASHVELEELKERAQEYAAIARERLTEGNDLIRNYVIREPVKAVGIAFGVGVLLGLWLKRR